MICCMCTMVGNLGIELEVDCMEQFRICSFIKNPLLTFFIDDLASHSTTSLLCVTCKDHSLTSFIISNDVKWFIRNIGHFHPWRSNGHSRHGKAGHGGLLGQEPLNILGRNMTFNEIAINDGGVAGLKIGRDGILFLDRSEVLDILTLYGKAMFLQMFDPSATTTSSR